MAKWRKWSSGEVKAWKATHEGLPASLSVYLALNGLRGPSQEAAKKLEAWAKRNRRPVLGGGR